jgi:hypothetical protein
MYSGGRSRTSSKRKAQCLSVDELPWTVSRSKGVDFGEDDEIYGLEEVENVAVIYEDTLAGKVARFEVGIFFTSCQLTYP